VKGKEMVWKYLIFAFALVGFVFSYPYIQDKYNIGISYKVVVLLGSVVLMFIITPLYWRAIDKDRKEEKMKYKRAKQPWE
jgi:membrane protein YdbS with pleckstrin-like domain